MTWIRTLVAYYASTPRATACASGGAPGLTALVEAPHCANACYCGRLSALLQHGYATRLVDVHSAATSSSEVGTYPQSRAERGARVYKENRAARHGALARLHYVYSTCRAADLNMKGESNVSMPSPLSRDA